MQVGPYRQRLICALCAEPSLVDVLDLGHTPLANAFASSADPQEVYPLVICLCSTCGHLQMRTLVDPGLLFGSYRYVTGTSLVTIAHLQDQAAAIAFYLARFGFKQPYVVEIGSNDGTALQIWRDKHDARVCGIDPAHAIGEQARAGGIPTLSAFFTPQLARELAAADGPADIILANNVFAHAEDLRAILTGVRHLLARDGVFVVEVSYLADILKHNAFDTIYHEHFSYHAVRPLQRALTWAGLKLFDVAVLPGQIGRGSLRLYIAHEASSRHVIAPRVAEFVMEEERAGFFVPATYERLRTTVEMHGTTLREGLNARQAKRHIITGYGAPAKLTTLMYTAKLNARHCAFIVDNSPWKRGLTTPGLHIPIFLVERWQQIKSDACVIWAWNFADSIMQRHRDYRGTWIIPLPVYREVKGPL